MAAQSSPPLDEVQHRRQDIVDWWVQTMGGQSMDPGIIHLYLAESPFFDHSTKNGLHFLQARSNAAAMALMQDRRRFEEDLKRHVGSEYLIVAEPQEVAKPTSPGVKGEKESSGVYVLRKQQRERPRGADGRIEEELTTLGTYYLVGENMYQAPSVGDIIGSRLLSATTNLSKFFETAANLPSFSPTTGYTYLPPTTQPAANAAGTSSHASPTRSREGSVLPGAGTTAATAADTQSLRSASLVPESHPLSTSTTSNLSDARLLAQSFKQSLEFSDEYADENPLLGEPGHFSFTSSLAAVSKRKRKAADDEAAALAAKARQMQEDEKQQVAASMNKGKDAVVKMEESGGGQMAEMPPAVMSTAQTTVQNKEGLRERRGSKIGKKRQKSRANLGSLVGVAEAGAT